MSTRYMTPQKERKVTGGTSSKGVGGIGTAQPKSGKSAGKGFPTCIGSGGTFGSFKHYAFAAPGKKGR